MASSRVNPSIVHWVVSVYRVTDKAKMIDNTSIIVEDGHSVTLLLNYGGGAERSNQYHFVYKVELSIREFIRVKF